MRRRQDPQVTLLALIDLETRVPSDHPLRVIKKLADQALKALSPDLDRMYANVGRPSIPRCWVRHRQLRKPGWHDLTMGCLCPAPPKGPVRKTEGAESPV